MPDNPSSFEDEFMKSNHLSVASESIPNESQRQSPTRLRVGTSKTDDIYRQKRQTKHIISQNEVFLQPKFFDNQNFDAQSYLNDVLQDLSEDEFVSLYNKLLRIHMGVRKNLEKNFYKNLNEYVFISGEVESMTSDFKKFQSLLKTLETDIEGLNLVDHTHDPSDESIKQTVQRLRSSIEGLDEAFWEAPQRQLICEQYNWMLINIDNQRPKLLVNMLLFNDRLLVTTSHMKEVDFPAKQQVLYNWNLTEISISSIETYGPAGAEMLQKEKEVSLYKLSINHNNKTTLLAVHNSEERDYMVRQARHHQLQELENWSRKHDEDLEFSRELEYHTKSEQADMCSYTSFQVLCKNLDTQDILQAYAKQRNMVKEISMQFDHLDIQISLQEFTDAIRNLALIQNKLERGNLNELFAEFFADKLHNRKRKVTEILLHQLGFKGISLSHGKEIVRYLRSLGHEKEGQGVFMKSRTLLIKEKCLNVQLEKDTPNFIDACAFIVFRCLAQTTSSYLQLFELKKLDPAYRNWIFQQIEALVDLIENQYKHLAHDRSYTDAVSKIMTYNTELKEAKIDAMPILQRLFDVHSKDLK
ncbi:exocyst complex subunit Exo8 [Schizosaccharomyces pombe]|uniref:Exocyst complex component exo84 n=1 Tax=Schizosaccharomyces pombe (strain 972 / ATCC 24843) TaxID=284812 RepID=EXO84_SCHPO|nr:putative exocyst complex subunit Exo84 [Schizosaccharomyces pombe]O14226.2 RecName: Full=Exocyst complex component exo84 [Schizosaccharomyces pombe 972h-]CAB11092.2 exocyst complex subunit Exo84 (predicted) [Schizosaccharomyces pombe]|eukprot:NP_001342837.1 putative exocyst complex subunit Exo84 [Schizosaccharomyces pombe]